MLGFYSMIFTSPVFGPYLVGPIVYAFLRPIRRYLPKTDRPWSLFLISMTLPPISMSTYFLVIDPLSRGRLRFEILTIIIMFILWIPFLFQVWAFVSNRRLLLKYAKWLTVVGYALPAMGIIVLLAFIFYR